jgi:hypothetical protein
LLFTGRSLSILYVKLKVLSVLLSLEDLYEDGEKAYDL